ncbi:MAG: hypothetical protein DSZ29_04340, partial [Aquificaceae bacterium]
MVVAFTKSGTTEMMLWRLTLRGVARIHLVLQQHGFDGVLVLQQHCIDGYRAIQSVQDKAWVAGNGSSLGKTHNAVLDALGCSLRASQKAVIHVVALFVKGVTIPCKVRLVANRFLTRC